MALSEPTTKQHPLSLSRLCGNVNVRRRHESNYQKQKQKQRGKTHTGEKDKEPNRSPPSHSLSWFQCVSPQAEAKRGRGTWRGRGGILLGILWTGIPFGIPFPILLQDCGSYGSSVPLVRHPPGEQLLLLFFSSPAPPFPSTQGQVRALRLPPRGSSLVQLSLLSTP